MISIKVHDAITYEIKLFGVITDKKIADYFYDENYRTIIHGLRPNPKTVDEIVEMFEKAKNPKSLMTVYRYLRHLIKAGIVVEAGKRIITDDQNRNKTSTLYCTTSLLFYDDTFSDESLDSRKSTIRRREIEVYSMLIKMLTGKEASMDCLNGVIGSVYDEGLKNISQIMESSEKDLNKYLSDFGVMMTNTLIVHIGWLSLILDEEIREKLLDCAK